MSKDSLARKASRVSLVPTEHRDLPDHAALQDLQGHKVIKVLQVLQEAKVTRASLEVRV